MSWINNVRAKPGAFVTVEKLAQGGTLQARVDRAGACTLYYRAKRDGQEVRERIGLFDATHPPRSLDVSAKGGYCLAGAQAKAVQLAVEHRTIPGGLAAKKREQTAQRKHADAERVAIQDMTVQALFDDYAAFQAQRGKLDHQDAKTTLRRFITANPGLGSKVANEATAQDFVPGLRALNEAGKVREPGKVRSYAHAAYQVALFAATDPTIPGRFERYRISINPLTAIRATPARADKRPLTVDEMRTYWRIAQETPGHRGALMRLHLLLGGQRSAQLLRLRRDDVREDHIVLDDGKGRRPEPRRHVVPLLPTAAADLGLFSGSGFVFAVDGDTPIRPETVHDWEADAVGERIKDFQPKRLRCGVETALSALGVSSKVRAHLQSHGLGGVQDRHYDAHDYFEEKLSALHMLFDLLNSEVRTNVLPLRRTG